MGARREGRFFTWKAGRVGRSNVVGRTCEGIVRVGGTSGTLYVVGRACAFYAEAGVWGVLREGGMSGAVQRGRRGMGALLGERDVRCWRLHGGRAFRRDVFGRRLVQRVLRKGRGVQGHYNGGGAFRGTPHAPTTTVSQNPPDG